MSRNSKTPATGGAMSPKAASEPTAISVAANTWGVASGYGRVAIALCTALEALGVKLALRTRPVLTGDGPPAVIEALDCEAVLHIGDPSTWKPVERKRNIGLCWWPFSKMPPGFRQYLYGMQHIIVPSQWCLDGAELPQPNQKISVIPLGVNDGVFVPQKRVRGEQLRFLVFDSRANEYRAGCDVAIAAFMRAFPRSREDVVLDIWGTYSVDVDSDDRRVQLRRHIGADADLVRLYNRYDALISPARGSGFGLVPIEAMATGMPVLHSGQTGFAEYADLGTLIGTRKAAVPMTIQVGAVCYEPLVDLLAERLQQIDSDYSAFQSNAIKDSRAVRKRFTWKASAKALLDVLEGRAVEADQSGNVPQPIGV